MNRRRLITLIDSYGADPARWPAAERTTARAALWEQRDATTLLMRGKSVDRPLDDLAEADRPPAPSANFLAGLYRIPQQVPRPTGIPLPDWLTAWPKLSSLAATAALAGFLLGTTGLLAPPPEIEIELGAALYGTNTIVETMQ